MSGGPPRGGVDIACPSPRRALRLVGLQHRRERPVRVRTERSRTVGAREAWLGASFAALVGLVPQSAHAQRVVYLNLEPTTINDDDGHDPSRNSFGANPGFVPGPVSGAADLSRSQAELLAFYVGEALTPFDVSVTLDRPEDGQYEMIVFGSAEELQARFPGFGCSPSVALGDCLDDDFEQIGFVFRDCMNEAERQDMRAVAHHVSFTLGLGWGLEPVRKAGTVMGGLAPGNEPSLFAAQCVELDSTQNCAHEACSAGLQDATAELLVRLGARRDEGAPEVTITSPAPLAVSSSEVTVEAEVEDDAGGLLVELFLVETGERALDARPPYRWDLQGLPDGRWTLEVIATDVFGNVATDRVRVCTGAGECPLFPSEQAPDPEQESSATGGEADGSSGSSGSSTGGGSEGAGASSQGRSGSCAVEGRPRGGCLAAVLTLLLMGSARKRRRER